MNKEYELRKSVSRSTIRVLPSKFVTFNSIGQGTRFSTGFPRYGTSEKEEQEAIEKSKPFKDGIIKLLSVKKTEIKTSTEDASLSLQKDLNEKAGANEKLKAELDEKVREKAELEAKLEELEAKMNLGNTDSGRNESEADESDVSSGDGDDTIEGCEPKDYPKVTNMQEAREILRRDYGASPQATNTRAAIENRMREFNVNFSNIVWD